MQKQPISSVTVLEIREANKKLLDTIKSTHAARYRELSVRFNLSEWIIRWICQGREYVSVGGFIERFNHEGSSNRAISDKEALEVREAFNRNETVRNLAKKFGVSSITITRILLGKTYRNVGGPIFNKVTLNNRMNNKPSAVVKTLTNPPLSKKFSTPLVSANSKNDIPSSQATPIKSVSSTPNLSTIDVFLIRTGYAFGASIESLQLQFRISKQTVIEIINGKMFPNLPGPKETTLA